MMPAEFRSHPNYLGAIGLGPMLVELTEGLPVHEQTGLVMQLHHLMVELPAAVAADLSSGTNERFGPLFRLIAAVDLIDLIYPALDTAGFRQKLFELSARLHEHTQTEDEAGLPAGEIEAPNGDDESEQPSSRAHTEWTDDPDNEPVPAREHTVMTSTGESTLALPVQPGINPAPTYERPEDMPLTAAPNESQPRQFPPVSPVPPVSPPVAPTYVKIDPVSALPNQRPAGQSNPQTIHVQPDSIQ